MPSQQTMLQPGQQNPQSIGKETDLTKVWQNIDNKQ